MMIFPKGNTLNFKIIRFITIFSLITLVGCSGVPMRLKSTADRSMKFLTAEMATHYIFLEPVLVDQNQINENLWCLSYEIGPDYFFSSRWEKQENQWVRTELHPFVENCDWAR